MLYNRPVYKDRVPSDSELLLGSVFVVCVLVGVGLLGDDDRSDHMVITPASMTAVGTAPATGANGFNANTSQAPRKEAKNLADCKQKIPNTSGYATEEYACNDNCVYYVKGSQVQPVYQANTKPGIVQMYVFSIFGGSYKVGKCTERGLAGSLGNMDNSYRTLGYQNANAFQEVNTLAPAASAAQGVQSGANAQGQSYAGQPSTQGSYGDWSTRAQTSQPYKLPGDVPNAGPFGELNPGASKTTGYSWNNLPTQQGTYPWDGVSGGYISYTPGANGQTGTYDFWSTANINETSMGGGGMVGANAPSAGSPSWVRAGDQSDWGDMTVGTYQKYTMAGNDPTWGDMDAPETGNIYDQPPNEACAQNPSACIGGPAVAKGPQQATTKGTDVSIYTGAPPASTPPPAKTSNPSQDYSAFTGDAPTQQSRPSTYQYDVNSPFCGNPIECAAKYQSPPSQEGPSLTSTDRQVFDCKPNFFGAVAVGTTEWVRKQLGYCK